MPFDSARTTLPLMGFRPDLDQAHHDIRDGDPYLEALVRQLVQLGGDDIRSSSGWARR